MDEQEWAAIDFDDPRSVRAAAARCHARAERLSAEMAKTARFGLQAIDHNPFADVGSEDPAVVEEREALIRTERAKQELLAAYEADKAETARQAEQQRARMRRQVLGGLMG
jgi:hypothetical protein